MKIKPGCSVRGIQPEMAVAILVATATFQAHGIRATLTEATGGAHTEGSSHYIGFAVDMRDREIPGAEQVALIAELQNDLGGVAEFQVINEVDHFHIQFKPKAQVKG